MTKFYLIMAITFGMMGLLFTVGPFWWWALWGLSEPIGQACGVTGFMSFIISLFFTMMYEDVRD